VVRGRLPPVLDRARRRLAGRPFPSPKRPAIEIGDFVGSPLFRCQDCSSTKCCGDPAAPVALPARLGAREAGPLTVATDTELQRREMRQATLGSRNAVSRAFSVPILMRGPQTPPSAS